jgi:hypothetical protein
MNSLSSAINTKCGEQLAVRKHKLRKSRLIIYNVSEGITTENATDIIKAQNPYLIMNEEDVLANVRYKTRKGNYNLVSEVGSQTRKQILEAKLKTGWEIRNVEDCLVPTSCYRCSRFNHKHNDCKGEESCPHCLASIS